MPDTIAASAVVIIGSRALLPQQADANTILTAFTVRRYLSQQTGHQERKRALYVIAEVLDEENVEHARTAGVDEEERQLKSMEVMVKF